MLDGPEFFSLLTSFTNDRFNWIRYQRGSAKESTQMSKECGASSFYKLCLTTSLPSQKIVLTVTANKMQLIDLLSENLLSQHQEFTQHKLIITGSDIVPIEINNRLIIRRRDMATTHEEAGLIIVQQAANGEEGTIVAHERGIFVLLLYFKYQEDVLSCYHGFTNSRLSNYWH